MKKKGPGLFFMDCHINFLRRLGLLGGLKRPLAHFLDWGDVLQGRLLQSGPTKTLISRPFFFSFSFFFFSYFYSVF